MNVAIFGGFGDRPLGPGWTKETAVAVFGGGDVKIEPGDGPEIRVHAVAILGGVEIKTAQ